MPRREHEEAKVAKERAMCELEAIKQRSHEIDEAEAVVENHKDNPDFIDQMIEAFRVRTGG